MAAHVEVREDVLLKFAKNLASNETKIRIRSVKKLRKWLQNRSKAGHCLSAEDFLKIWKGLHFCMWMCDKPLVQEDLADTLAELIHCFSDPKVALTFIDVFFQTQVREWHGIDGLRLDKFLLLVRRMLGQSFVLLQRNDWDEEHIRSLMEILERDIIGPANDDSTSMGLRCHVTDIYLSELEKVAKNQLPEDKTLLLLGPYCQLLYSSRNKRFVQQVLKSIFYRILGQAVSKAIQESEGTKKSSRKHGLQYNYSAIADSLFELSSSPNCVPPNRKLINKVVKKFRNRALGIVPTKREPGPEPKMGISKKKKMAAVARLQKLEESMIGPSKSERKKKRKQLAQEEDDDDGSPSRKKKRIEENVAESTHTTLDQDAESGMKKGKAKKGKNQAKNKFLKGAGSDLKQGQKVKAKAGEDQGKKNLKTAAEKSKLSLSEGASDDADGEISQVNSEVDHTPSPIIKLTPKKTKKKKKIQSTSDQAENESVEPVPIGEDVIDAVSVTKSIATNSKKEPAIPALKDCDGSLDELTNQEIAVQNKNIADTSVEYSGKKNKKKRKSVAGDGLDMTHGIGDGDSPTVTLKRTLDKTEATSSGRKKKRKSLSQEETCASSNKVNGHDAGNKLLDEVEIWLPSKKYKGPLKGKFEKSMNMQKTSNDGSVKKNKQRLSAFAVQKMKSADDEVAVSVSHGQQSKAFASFEKVLKTPPAFVKRAVVKSGYGTEPRKAKKAKTKSPQAPSSAPGATKRVSFAMNRNSAQEFNDSLTMSPVVPFDPEISPCQSILKSPATPLDQTLRMKLFQAKTKRVGMPAKPAGKAGKRAKVLRKKAVAKRARAADFF